MVGESFIKLPKIYTDSTEPDRNRLEVGPTGKVSSVVNNDISSVHMLVRHLAHFIAGYYTPVYAFSTYYH